VSLRPALDGSFLATSSIKSLQSSTKQRDSSIVRRLLTPSRMSVSTGGSSQSMEILVMYGAISLTDRYSIRNKFLRMRLASHRAPGFFQQLQLLFGSALIYKLYVLSSQIGAIKLQLEVRRDTLLIYPSTDGGRLSLRWTNTSCPRISTWRAVSLQCSHVLQLVRI
jgi:hypothetical protein